MDQTLLPKLQLLGSTEPPRLEWKIWFWHKRYGLTTHTNLDTELADLPILPVALIANIRRDINGTRFCIEHGRNYYCLIPYDNEWWASTLSGLTNYIDTYRGDAAILRGGMTPNAIFQQAYYEAKNDPEILEATVHEFERDREEGAD